MPIPHVRMPTVFFSKEHHCFNCERSFRSITLVRLISSRLEVLSCQIYTNHNSKRVQSSRRRTHTACQLLHRRLQHNNNNNNNNNNDYDDDSNNPLYLYCSLLFSKYLQRHYLMNTAPPLTHNIRFQERHGQQTVKTHGF